MPLKSCRTSVSGYFPVNDDTRVGRAARAFATIEFQTHAKYARNVVPVDAHSDCAILRTALVPLFVFEGWTCDHSLD